MYACAHSWCKLITFAFFRCYFCLFGFSLIDVNLLKGAAGPSLRQHFRTCVHARGCASVLSVLTIVINYLCFFSGHLRFLCFCLLAMDLLEGGAGARLRLHTSRHRQSVGS